MSRKKSKNSTLNICLSLITLVLAILIVVGIFVDGLKPLFQTYSLVGLFEISDRTSFFMTALLALLTAISAVILAVLAILSLLNIKIKSMNILNIVFGVLTALFAILTFLMIPIDLGFDHIGDYFLAGMWLTFIPGIIALPVALFNRK